MVPTIVAKEMPMNSLAKLKEQGCRRKPPHFGA
jgi:hypothetical protein